MPQTPSDHNWDVRTFPTKSSPSKPSTSNLNGLSPQDSTRNKQVIKSKHDASHVDPAHGMNYSPAPTCPAFSPPPQSQRYPLQQCQSIVENIDFRLTMLIDAKMDCTGDHPASQCFHNPDLAIPITQESLAELDMPRIINNPKLRHDVNFDKELHFRPNLDGSKGKQKMALADQYWRALEAEFVLYGQVLLGKAQAPDREADWDRIMEASRKRLPLLFETIRGILKTLVPDYDQKAVQDRLDVKHIMQQIQNGVCDLIDLGNWLAKVLKNHCAPMRDSLVDGMQEEIRRGAMENVPKRLVNGLRQLMTILEAMKLDVANHQIRHMRPLLIDDTINFQRRYNSHRMGLGKIDVEQAKTWFRDRLHQAELYGQWNPAPIQVTTFGLLHDLVYSRDSASFSSSSSQSFTSPTFYLDSDRLRTLQSDLHAQVYHAICREIMLDPPEAFSLATSHRAAATLQRSLTSIVGATTLHRFPDKVDNIAVEILRVRHRYLPSRSSGLHPIDSEELINIDAALHASLHPGSRSFRHAAKRLFARLLPRLERKVSDHWRYTAVDLQDMLAVSKSGSSGTSSTSSSSSSSSSATPTLVSFSGIGAKLTPPSTTGSSGTVDPFDFFPSSSAEAFVDYDTEEDLVRRLAHIIILHWQVWADLVYHSVAEESTHRPSPCPTSTPPTSVSPASSNESLNGTTAALSRMGSKNGSCTSLLEQRVEMMERMDEVIVLPEEVNWEPESEVDEDGDEKMSDED